MSTPMKVLLTSAGFENPNIQARFLALVTKRSEDIRALFIPTAAVSPDAILMLPKCLEDLLRCGIPKENITVCDLHRPLAVEALNAYDVLYVCGGDTRYLLSRVNEAGLGEALLPYLRRGGVYVGVSAGSLITACNLPDNLGLLPNRLHVHCETGTAAGDLAALAGQDVSLTDAQAVWLHAPGQGTIIE